MHIAGGALIFACILLLYFVVIISLYTRRGSAINQHPYRDPYGDAPGAWRTSSLLRDKRATIETAPGTR